jgi:adenosylcobinamide kinase / adenosylcobinamide-phosphate guanylyltransferase
MAMTLLIGGVRAGKSGLACRLAAASDRPVTVIATAEAGDEEMARRIARHRASRPADWTTIEEPIHLARALEDVGSGDTVVLDCLTLWVSNLLLAGRDEGAIVNLAEDSARLAATREGPTYVVTNEVGSGVHPSSELGRRYRDLLGGVNVIWSQAASEALMVVAGRSIPLGAPPA